MKDYISIGPSPVEEDCVQLGDPDYRSKARKECVRFIELIRKVKGPEAGSARLAITSNPHDFGTYLDVVCYYDDEDEAGMNYAFDCESETPMRWDDGTKK